MLSIDTETYLITDENPVPKLVCVSWADGSSSGVIKACAQDVWMEKVREALDVGFIAHNASFDVGVLLRAAPELTEEFYEAFARGKIYDTMIRARLIDLSNGRMNSPTLGKSPYSLASLTKRFLGIELEKDEWRLQYASLDGVPLSQWPSGAVEYARLDAETTLQLWRDQEQAGSDRLVDQHRQVRAAWWLRNIEVNGLPTDQHAVAALIKEHEKAIAEIDVLATAAGLVDSKGKKNVKLIRDLVKKTCEDHGFEPPTTEKGAVKADAETLEKLGAFNEVLGLIKSRGQHSYLVSTPLKMLSRPIVRARFGMAETGRTTASPNVQNFPRKGGLRECVAARPGFVLIGADYDGLELRTMAQACLELVGRSTMADMLNKGMDLHCYLASFMLGLSYEETVNRKKEEAVDNARQSAKVANFGFPGGMGSDTLVFFAAKSYGVSITPEAAKELRDLWFNTFPEFRDYFRRISQMESDGVFEVVQPISQRMRQAKFFTEACNSQFQGLGADATKNAGFLIQAHCDLDFDDGLFGSKIVNYVHDEFLIEVPERWDHDYTQPCEALRSLMVEGASEFLPDVPPRVSEVWAGTRWSKKAFENRDAKGRIRLYDV